MEYERVRKLRALWAQVEDDIYDNASWISLGEAVDARDAAALGTMILKAYDRGQQERLIPDRIDEAMKSAITDLD